MAKAITTPTATVQTAAAARLSVCAGCSGLFRIELKSSTGNSR
jgi:hypothetical protein